MPFYKVPAAVISSSNNGGPHRIRAPLRHSVNNGDTATTSRDSDVISSDVIASAGESKRPTSYLDQVHFIAQCVGHKHDRLKSRSQHEQCERGVIVAYYRLSIVVKNVRLYFFYKTISILQNFSTFLNF